MIYTVDDIELEVNYGINWGYAATREEPGEPAYVDYLEVLLADHDITSLLSNAVLREIEEACFEDAKKNREYDFEPPEEY